MVTVCLQPQNTKATVCALLHWDDLAYGEFQYKTGLAYLKHYIPNDPAGADMLCRSKTYWNWWKINWANRDFEFLSHNYTCKCQTPLLVTIYKEYHDAKTLAAEIYPSGLVLGVSYKRMIQELFDSEIQAL